MKSSTYHENGADKRPVPLEVFFGLQHERIFHRLSDAVLRRLENSRTKLGFKCLGNAGIWLFRTDGKC